MGRGELDEGDRDVLEARRTRRHPRLQLPLHAVQLLRRRHKLEHGTWGTYAVTNCNEGNVGNVERAPSRTVTWNMGNVEHGERVLSQTGTCGTCGTGAVTNCNVQHGECGTWNGRHRKLQHGT